MLKFGSPEFAEFLHERGFSVDGKFYKLFSFGLEFDKARFERTEIKLLSPNVNLTVSSTMVDYFIQNFVMGAFQRQTIEIYSNGILSQLDVEMMESLKEPEFTENMKFKMISPVVLSTKREQNGKLGQYFFRYYDDINEINRVFNQNLINKYKLVNKIDYSGKPLMFRWDTDYIKRQTDNGKKITRLVTVNKPNEQPVNFVGNVCPFFVSGSPELIKTGYDCGFGEKNSMGFGLCEAITN